MENNGINRGGLLSLCPTPIGNLEDISLRTLRVLREADLILCEDTRHSLGLLQAYDIKKPLMSYHKFNEEARLEEIVKRLKEGERIALISDAGMPGVSDPGEVLVGRLIEEGMDYEVLPGPCAHVTATVAANIKEGRYLFWGFLPQKAGPRDKVLESLKNIGFPVVFYEAPHRIEKTIGAIEEVLGNRDLVLARELTKVYEEVVFTKAQDFLKDPGAFTLKGEFVLILMPEEAKEEEVDIKAKLWEKIESGMRISQAVKEVARECNLPKNQVYKESLELE